MRILLFIFICLSLNSIGQVIRPEKPYTGGTYPETDPVWTVDKTDYMQFTDSTLYATQYDISLKANTGTLSNYFLKSDTSSTVATQFDISSKADASALSSYLLKSDSLIFATVYDNSLKADILTLSNYLEKSDSITGYATQYDISLKANSGDLTSYILKSDSVTGYATQYDNSLKADASSLSTYFQKSDTSSTVATLYDISLKADASSLSNYLAKSDSLTGYATQYDISLKADASSLNSYLLKSDTSLHTLTKTSTLNLNFGYAKQPNESLPIDFQFGRSGANSRMSIQSFGSTTEGSYLTFDLARGTYDNQNTLTAGRLIGGIYWRGGTSTTEGAFGNGAYILGYAAAGSNWSGTNTGAYLKFGVTKASTATNINPMNINADGTVETYYGQKLPYYNDTSETYSATTDNYIIYVDATTGNKTVNLPAIASSDKLTFIIKRIDNTANVVTIEPNLLETIEKQPNITLGYLTSIKIHCVAASGWYIIGN